MIYEPTMLITSALDSVPPVPMTTIDLSAAVPGPVPPKVKGYEDAVVSILLAGPDTILGLQRKYDEADRVYRTSLAVLAIDALSVAIFPPKKDGEPKRTASNDTERQMAVDHLATTDVALVRATEEREICLRLLQHAKNEFEAAKLLVQLSISQGRK